MKKAVARIEDKTEKKLTQVFAKFADHRDFRVGAQLTSRDVDHTAAFAKAKLVDAYDVNNNGLEKKEVAKMSLTGQLAVLLSKQNAG
jgi:soluble cytochrome b562